MLLILKKYKDLSLRINDKHIDRNNVLMHANISKMTRFKQIDYMIVQKVQDIRAQCTLIYNI